MSFSNPLLLKGLVGLVIASAVAVPITLKLSSEYSSTIVTHYETIKDQLSVGKEVGFKGVLTRGTVSKEAIDESQLKDGCNYWKDKLSEIDQGVSPYFKKRFEKYCAPLINSQ